MLGPGDNTGVLREEYHHRPSGQGGSNDAQHRQHYHGSRDADGPLPRSHLPARLRAKAADVRRSLLLLARPSRPPDSVAGVVSAAARSLCHRREDVCHRPCDATDFIPTGQDKDAIVATYRAKFTAREGVVIIGVAQEKARAFKAHKRCGPQGGVTFYFTRQSVSVNHYYFYVHDDAWGPAFIKIGTYVPYPLKICSNGHEWVKQQLHRRRIRFESLDNGFLSCADPDALQATCDALGPRDIQTFFDRWSHRLPWPLRPEDRAAGFDHRVTLCQLEISRTQIFDRPVQGRHFFEAVIRENLDLGRPSRVRLLFPRRITRATPPP